MAINTTAALAADTDNTAEFVETLWNRPPPSGKWRYYDGMLYTMALLHLSGNFKIYEPTQ
jgi:oligosaccharide reducing-end xylanase